MHLLKNSANKHLMPNLVVAPNHGRFKSKRKDCCQKWLSGNAGNARSSLLICTIADHDLAIKSTTIAAYTAAQITPPKNPMHARPVIRRYLQQSVLQARDCAK